MPICLPANFLEQLEVLDAPAVGRTHAMRVHVMTRAATRKMPACTRRLASPHIPPA